MSTYHIHINGIVQGVGFRPMVYQLAKELQMNGYVKNGNDGVHVFFNGSEEVANSFFRKIKLSVPLQARIISSQLQKTNALEFDEFSIVVEEDDCVKNVLISPDKAICENCRNELYDITNRRYRYPFITCTQCGPRYSIMESLPYERHRTSMQKLAMCENCNDEYNNVSDRRFFSQTNSCDACGIKLSIYENASSILSKNSEEVLQHTRNLLLQGKILALKGIGGYLLLCSADNAETIQLLRKRKRRPSKPFAVLYPDLETIRNNFELSEKEQSLLGSPEAPIVLLYAKQLAFNNIDIKNIAPRLKRVGVMVPYSPLLELIAKDYSMPLIATSANVSGSPIIYKDEEAVAWLFGIADYIVSYNRDIIIPEDDSVVQFTNYFEGQIILRRSRGYAPSFLPYKPKRDECILSTGAFLKSSFTLSVSGNVFVSQFLGGGESYESQLMYKDTMNHWFRLYSIKPDVILTDLHPGYFSRQYAIELSEKYNCDIRFIQHHEAHFAAVLAENNLLHSTEPVLGIIWDGTGLGSDGNIWGGEFFKYENNEMLRYYHFDYFPAIAGDKLALEPRIAALCTSSETWLQPEGLKKKFTEEEWNNYQSLVSTSHLFSSSVGRIFDAVASLLDVCDRQTYEGEAAMYLQALAEEYVETNGFGIQEGYFKEDAHYYRIPTASLIEGILMDIKRGKAKSYIAARFHFSLVMIVDIVAKNLGISKICFSGGVFQNALLVDWIHFRLGGKYQLYFHKDLSPNDENISFGQLVYFDNNINSITRDDLEISNNSQFLIHNS